jgi:hypothetical protein
MTLICKVVKDALSSGYLTPEAEDSLRHLFSSSCQLEDITALTMLQRAVTSGKVKRLSQESLTV